MKSLNDYVGEAQSTLFDELGVFFAFSNSQFITGCKKVGALNDNDEPNDNKISGFGHGGYVLSKNFDKFLEEMEKINTEGIKQDIQENGLTGIIQRELANYEVQITRDWKQLIEVLEDYPGITEDLIKEQYHIYYQKCIDNDWF